MSEEIKFDPLSVLVQTPLPVHHTRRVLHDDDQDDEPMIFDPGHPLQHPRDDNVPLPYLIGKSYSYIKATIANRSDAVASIIRSEGCSLNRANEIRRENYHETRRRVKNEQELYRIIDQLDRDITKMEAQTQDMKNALRALKDQLTFPPDEQ